MFILLQYLKDIDQQQQLSQSLSIKIQQFLQQRKEFSAEQITEVLSLIPQDEDIIQLQYISTLELLKEYTPNEIQPVLVQTFKNLIKIITQQRLNNAGKKQIEIYNQYILDLLQIDTSEHFSQALIQITQNQIPTSKLQTLFQQLSQQQIDNIINNCYNYDQESCATIIQELNIKQNLDQYATSECNQMRQVICQGVKPQTLLMLQYDKIYQVRVAFVNNLGKTNEIKTNDKLKILSEKAMDKNVYVRKASFICLQDVISNIKLQCYNEQTIQQSLQQIQENKELNDEERINVQQLLEDQLQTCKYIQQILQQQIERIQQMQVSELTEFLQLVLLLLQNDSYDAKQIMKQIIKLSIIPTTQSIQKVLCEFLIEYIMMDKNDQKLSKCNALIDIIMNISNIQLLNQIFDMLMKYEQFNKIINDKKIIDQALSISQTQQNQIQIRSTSLILLQLLIKYSNNKIYIDGLICSLAKSIQEGLDQQDLFFIQQLTKTIYLSILNKKYKNSDQFKQNLQSLINFIKSQPQILFYPGYHQYNIIQLLFFQTKGEIDGLFSLLQQNIQTLDQQSIYCYYSSQLLVHLMIIEQQDIKSKQIDQQDETNYIQEYSYLVYSCISVIQTLNNKQLKLSLQNQILLIQSLTNFGISLTTDISLDQKSIIQMIFETFINIIQDQSFMQQEIIQGLLLQSITTLTISKPSEFNQCFKQLLKVNLTKNVLKQVILISHQLLQSNIIKFSDLVNFLAQNIKFNECIVLLTQIQKQVLQTYKMTLLSQIDDQDYKQFIEDLCVQKQSQNIE